MALMKDVYRCFMNGIERLKAQGEILSELLDSLKFVIPISLPRAMR